MSIENLGMVVQEGNRTKAYLQALIDEELIPHHVILVTREGRKLPGFERGRKGYEWQHFDPSATEEELLKKHGISYEKIEAGSVNDEIVVEALRERPEKYYIFSGSGILKEALTAGKKLIHAHPGRIPDFRGSTVFLYSILEEDSTTATAFIMNEGIDQGEIIATKEFGMPDPDIDVCREHDPYIRSQVLVEVVKELAETDSLKTTKQEESNKGDYYMIHPVLRNIALAQCQNQEEGRGG